MTAPCKNCNDRNSMCHSTCVNYIQYKKEVDRIRDKRGEAKELEYSFHLIETRRLKRIIHYRLAGQR